MQLGHWSKTVCIHWSMTLDGVFREGAETVVRWSAPSPHSQKVTGETNWELTRGQRVNGCLSLDVAPGIQGVTPPAHRDSWDWLPLLPHDCECRRSRDVGGRVMSGPTQLQVITRICLGRRVVAD